MGSLLNKYCSNLSKITVLDLGSYDVNGTFKPLMKETWKYIGVDIAQGPNVDMVMPEEYKIPMDDNSVDLLISGSCLEHVKNPFRLFKEATRILKSNCYAFIMVPHDMGLHRFPIDCWRFFPDGMSALFEESNLKVVETYIVEQKRNDRADGSPRNPHKHCWGIGTKV